MLKVHSASPTLTASSAWSPFNWVASNDEITSCVSTEHLPAVRADFDEMVLSLPDQFTGFNYEYVANTCWQHLKYKDDAFNALTSREIIFDRYTAIRPQTSFCFYTLPEPTWSVTKDRINEPARIAEQEAAYAQITPERFIPSLTAYWKSERYTDEEWVIWGDRVDFAITMARVVHNKDPVAFVWDGGGGWKAPMPIDKFKRILRYLYVREIDIVYWSAWGSPAPVSWETQYALWQYTTGDIMKGVFNG